MNVFEFYELSAWPLYITTVSYVIDPLQMNICSFLLSPSVKPKAAFLRTKQLSLQFPYDYMSQEDEAFSTSSERVTTQLNILFQVFNPQVKADLTRNTNTFTKTKRMYCMINVCPSLSHRNAL